MFQKLNLQLPDPGKILFQCPCGTQRLIPNHPTCPACGKTIPHAVSTDDAPWISYLQFKIDGLRRALEQGRFDEVPAEHRKMLTKNLTEQIRKLENGTWATEARERLGTLTRMLHADAPNQTPREEWDAMQEHLASQIQTLREELEAAGESTTPTHLLEDARAGGPRPRIPRQQWQTDPMKVVQRTVLAITFNIPPENMTPPQRTLVHAWLYAQSMETGGHGQLFYNAATNHDDTIQSTREALHTLPAPAHAEIFEKATTRWHAKPRHFPEAETTDPEQLKASLNDTFEPTRAEFQDLDEAASHIQPTIETCIETYMRNHLEEFVDLE